MIARPRPIPTLATLATLGLLAQLIDVPCAAADDKLTAQALFARAKQLELQGNPTEACPLYEASYRADPQLGAFLNIANCHELVGQTGTAWAEFREAIELATRRQDPRVDYARRRVAALTPRLVKLRIDTGDVPHGFSVRRDAIDVTGLLGEELVVDPGSYALEATAPGRLGWIATIDVLREGETQRVQIPALLPERTASSAPSAFDPSPHEAPVPQVRPAPPSPLATTAASRSPSSNVDAPARKISRVTPPFQARRTVAFIVGGAGLAVTAIGAGFGLHAYREWQASRDPSECDATNICSASGLMHIASARSSATRSTWLLGAGGGLVVAATVVWLTAPSREQPATRTVVAPVLDPSAPGVMVSGRF